MDGGTRDGDAGLKVGIPAGPAPAGADVLARDRAPAGTIKVVVAIHGVGSQLRGETVRAVAWRFGDDVEPPLPLLPLGHFNSGRQVPVQLSRLILPDEHGLEADTLAVLGGVRFAEAFWANVPERVVDQKDTLEDIKGWGKTVASRAAAAYVPVPGRPARPTDFALAAGVIDEMVEAIGVLQNLLLVAAKMGIFKFDLAPLLRDYVGDVQVVAEFGQFREEIVFAFHRTMADIVSQFENEQEFYVVAHSEGTVVSFLALLEALSVRQVVDPADAGHVVATEWIRFVRGYMTIGSPIDKHLVLWPELWTHLDPVRPLSHPIRWRNYYDYGDPIGFSLKTARQFLVEKGCTAFDFESDATKDDFGFARYWFPGKAHVDYWTDSGVFGHFIHDVVLAGTPAARRVEGPRGSVVRGAVSTAIPYLFSAALHVLAIFVLFKAVTAFVGAGGEPGQGTAHDPKAIGAALPPSLVSGVSWLSLVLFSATVAARLPRLVNYRSLVWPLVALAVLAVGGWAAEFQLSADVAHFIGSAVTSSPSPAGSPSPAYDALAARGHLACLGGATLLALTGWVAGRRPHSGRRLLLIVGAAVVVALILGRIWQAFATSAPVWPLFLGGAAFLYAWWLGILVFDLAFVWQRYIRFSIATRRLGEWWVAGAQERRRRAASAVSAPDGAARGR